jgi:hypothetical protein
MWCRIVLFIIGLPISDFTSIDKDHGRDVSGRGKQPPFGNAGDDGHV